ILTMISKKGTMFSSPPSSSGASSRGWLSRRILLRCAVLNRSMPEPSGRLALRNRQEVERALHGRLQVVLDRLGTGVQDNVGYHAEHRDAQAQGGVVHRLGNTG